MATKKGAKTGAKKPGKKRAGKFRGTSKQGDFHEALDNAIAAAKEGLTSSLVIWQLQDVSGQNGGFAQVNDLTVIIRARVP